MVGLDAVNHGAKKEEDLHACWNPKNVNSSVIRSKQYAIKASLAWTVDNVDMYLRLCNREPRLFGEEESIKIAQTKHSLYNKFKCVTDMHSEVDSCKAAFVDLLICWRNNLTHRGAKNELLEKTKRLFESFPDNDFLAKYHFEIKPMLDRFQNSEMPTFKEATTMISMAIHFVEELDLCLMEEVDQSIYLKNVLRFLYQKNPENISALYINSDAKKRLKKLKQCLLTAGISIDFYNESGDRYLETLSEMAEQDFKNLLISSVNCDDKSDDAI